MVSNFSARLPPQLDVNRISETLARLRRQGIPVVDMTESNPTRVNLPYPDGVLDALSDDRALQYEPQPFGLPSAREAVARDGGRRGAIIDPADVILTASTSESYSWLFKLLCNPGETILVPSPSYPLFEHLARLEGLGMASYRLEYHGRWEIDVDALRSAPSSTRAVILVSPNNPTGSYVKSRELDAVLQVCQTRGWALIVDEVFADYALEADGPLTDVATRAGVLAFTLGGASKTLGLPQVKLGWVVAGGPREERHAALDTLAHIADTFLSVSTPVQVAAPALFERGGLTRAAIHERVRRNLNRGRIIAAAYPACEILRVEGGWSAIVRIPATRSEEAWVLSLLTAERVLVHPGYFFDFPHEAFIVVSLLLEEQTFGDAFARALRFIN